MAGSLESSAGKTVIIKLGIRFFELALEDGYMDEDGGRVIYI
jgi:hypothetical protein